MFSFLQRINISVVALRNRTTVLFFDGLFSDSNLGNINKEIIRYNNNAQIFEKESKESMLLNFVESKHQTLLEKFKS